MGDGTQLRVVWILRREPADVNDTTITSARIAVGGRAYCELLQLGLISIGGLRQGLVESQVLRPGGSQALGTGDSSDAGRRP